MSRFRFSPTPAYDASIGSALKQEAFMNWGQIDLSWIQLKDKIVFQVDHDSNGSASVVPLQGQRHVARDSVNVLHDLGRKPESGRSQFTLPPRIELGGFAP